MNLATRQLGHLACHTKLCYASKVFWPSCFSFWEISNRPVCTNNREHEMIAIINHEKHPDYYKKVGGQQTVL